MLIHGTLVVGKLIRMLICSTLVVGKKVKASYILSFIMMCSTLVVGKSESLLYLVFYHVLDLHIFLKILIVELRLNAIKILCHACTIGKAFFHCGSC